MQFFFLYLMPNFLIAFKVFITSSTLTNYKFLFDQLLEMQQTHLIETLLSELTFIFLKGFILFVILM